MFKQASRVGSLNAVLEYQKEVNWHLFQLRHKVFDHPLFAFPGIDNYIYREQGFDKFTGWCWDNVGHNIIRRLEILVGK